jgi:hypothetical protein
MIDKMTNLIRVPGEDEITVLERRSTFQIEYTDWNRLKNKVDQIQYISRYFENGMWVAVGTIPSSLLAIVTFDVLSTPFWLAIIICVLSLFYVFIYSKFLQKLEKPFFARNIGDVNYEIIEIDNKVKKTAGEEAGAFDSLIIINANYCTDNNHSVDATDKLNELVSDNKLNVKATNLEFGGDPHQGVKKSIYIAYSYEGQVESAVFKENENIVLPLPK